MTAVTFGPSGDPRPLRRLVLLTAPHGMIVLGFGIFVAPEPAWRGMSRAMIALGAAVLLVGAALMAAEARSARGRSAGPSGVRTGRRTIAWSDITRLSLHAGAAGRTLVAVWPAGAAAPVWLGSADHATVPRDEALSRLEAWSGRPIEQR